MEKKQIILYGPLVQVKLFLSKNLPNIFLKGDENYQIIQFHQSYSYEDYIEEMKPQLSKTGEGEGFRLQDGLIKSFVKNARETKTKGLC